MNDPTASTNGWNEWSRHVLKELERLTDAVERVRDDFQQSKSTYAPKEEIEKMWDYTQEMQLTFLSKLQERDVALIKQLNEIEKAHELKMNELNYKAGVWGAMSGLIPVAIALLLYVIKELT